MSPICSPTASGTGATRSTRGYSGFLRPTRSRSSPDGSDSTGIGTSTCTEERGSSASRTTRPGWWLFSATRSRVASGRGALPRSSLSGGLDSSLIAALAVRSVGSSPSSSPGVTATSLIYPGLSCDESDYIRDVVAMIGLPSRTIIWTPRDWEQICREAARAAYLPPQPNAALDMFVRDGIQRTVVITGGGGDQWMNGSRAHFVDLMRARQYRELSTLVDQGAGRIIAQVVLEAVRARTIAHVRRPRPRESVPWVGRALRHHIERRVEPDVTTPSAVAKSTQERYRRLHAPSGAYNFEVTDQEATGGDLTVTSPFYDARLVQFRVRRA